jgi:pentatricopeptide repeat protein
MPTTTAFNVLIQTMEHVSECVPEVEAILREMKSSGVRIDSSTYTTAVVTCARSGHFDFVLSVLDQASLAFIELPLSTFHSVLSAFEKSGQFQNAIDLFQHMKESSNVQPSLITYTFVITCCARAGQWAKALELVNGSTFRGFEPTPTVFNACISACEKGCQLEKAVKVLRQMDSLKTASCFLFLHPEQEALALLQPTRQRWPWWTRRPWRFWKRWQGWQLGSRRRSVHFSARFHHAIFDLNHFFLQGMAETVATASQRHAPSEMLSIHF